MTFKEKYGKFALITGASSGIGKEIAFEIAKRGLDIIIVARREAELENVKKSIQNVFSVDVKIIATDIATDEGINRVLAFCDSLEIGLFIPCAGVENNGAFGKIELQKELSLIQLNIVSVVTLSYYFVNKMKTRRRGGILFVASLFGHTTSPYFANYGASKSYIVDFGVSLYAELKDLGIDVSILSPGLTDTAMTQAMVEIDMSKIPMKNMSPEEVAKIAIEEFGQKMIIIPGFGNKLMAFMAKYLTPLRLGAFLNTKLMKKAMKKELL